MQNKKNTTFLGILRLFFALELIKKRFKASFETYLVGEANLSKIKLIKSKIKGGYSVLVNYQSLLLNIFPVAPPPRIIFLYKI